MGKKTYLVTDTKAERLDAYISSQSGLTRSHVQKLIKEGHVLVNSSSAKAGHKAKIGDRIELTLPAALEGLLIPEDIPLDVIYDDEYMIVINKPPGMVMYPGLGHDSGTLMNAVASISGKLSSVGAPLRPGVVHRLDQDTSGLIVIAKDDTAHHELVKQFREREVEKHYLTLLYGNLKADSGEIKTLIGRSASSRKKMSAKPRSGKEAVTRYEVVKRFKFATLTKVRIITGRTHQIRVHFASIGFPVLGDKTYGKKTAIQFAQKTISFPRQMLHAYSLKLKHPVSGEAMEFTAPMPEDIKKAMEEFEG
ncbi:MAG: RluA family pseudouridine synthase [Nitrospirae bacterium]|nr:RluA family pseudouridine synthase [Nitrospirota bacterium]